ncbi:hypothetical protein CCACVL1_18251 [Corchorus capsularis]|uniref:Uncharacterized protein n=1 Tax=Corchorus capsularis TaxID=210143 RepID=A0A1R3HLZ4_COCAP|nr:hypothetical protein CCACVL1_18251 [Corchorus capsularis]
MGGLLEREWRQKGLGEVEWEVGEEGDFCCQRVKLVSWLRCRLDKNGRFHDL